VLSVAGLPVPEGGADEDAAREDAVRLFVQRAKRASLRFALTPEHAPHVREICRAVGGSPLAIELAAAWVRMFSPAEIAREVAHDLDFLSTASRSAPARHRSVRAAFEHSWRLLKPREQAVLGGLSVFHGGFQRDAAGTVLGATLATLASLVDKSLLRVAPGGRYDRHPLIYAYLREKLDERERVRLQGLHAAFYLELADALDARLQGPDDARELEVFEREHENLRAAGRWALTQAGDLALRLGGALGRFWEVRGYLGEGRAYLEEALARAPGAPAAVQARALIPLGRLTQLQGDLPHAEARFARALELARRAGDEESVAAALNRLGTAALDRESYAEAEACFREALDLYRALGDKGGMSILLNNLGEMARAQNDFRRARELYEASLALHGETGNTRRRALVLGNLGFVSWRLGETAQAEVFQKESLALKYEVRDEIGLSYCFAGLAAVSCELGAHGRAALLLGVVDALVARTKHQLDLVDRNDVQRTLEAVRATLGSAAFVAAQARGRTLSLGEAVAYALAAPPEQGAPSADEGASV
jgi:tetratricopeptide (TPR) repeat protein